MDLFLNVPFGVKELESGHNLRKGYAAVCPPCFDGLLTLNVDDKVVFFPSKNYSDLRWGHLFSRLVVGRYGLEGGSVIDQPCYPRSQIVFCGLWN